MLTDSEILTRNITSRISMARLNSLIRLEVSKQRDEQIETFIELAPIGSDMAKRESNFHAFNMDALNEQTLHRTGDAEQIEHWYPFYLYFKEY